MAGSALFPRIKTTRPDLKASSSVTSIRLPDGREIAQR
jgi:hypothetical protein